MKKNEVDGGVRNTWLQREVPTGFWLGRPKERDRLEDIGVGWEDLF